MNSNRGVVPNFAPKLKALSHFIFTGLNFHQYSRAINVEESAKHAIVYMFHISLHMRNYTYFKSTSIMKLMFK